MSKNELEAVPPHGLEEPASTRLKVVTGYFQAVGILSAVRILVLVGMALFAPHRILGFANSFPMPVMIGWVLTTIGYFWTARALRDRSRMAWLPAIATFAWPIVLTLAGLSVPAFTVVTAVAGILTLFSVRRELE
jgi:hypothetical protein